MSGDYGVRMPSTGKPKAIMVLIDKPDGSCRLYASRELPRDVGWGMEDGDWHVDARMKNVLIIDKPTWGECFARAFEIWGNWDHQRVLSTASPLPLTPLRSKMLNGPAHPEQRCAVCERLAGMPTAPCPSCADWTQDPLR